MPLQIVTGLKPEWWEPANNPPDGPKFLLAPLSQLALHDVLGEMDTVKRRFTSASIKRVLDECLRDWQGVEDQNGQPVACTSLNAEQIPSDMLHEITTHAVFTAMLSEDDLKNSQAQSKSKESPASSTAPTADASRDGPDGSDGTLPES